MSLGINHIDRARAALRIKYVPSPRSETARFVEEVAYILKTKREEDEELIRRIANLSLSQVPIPRKRRRLN
jgi:hypothetical protein